MPFSRPISDRYFEDYIEGDVHCFGTIAVEADEIVAFAKRFDPQTLHTDFEAARSGPFGGLIASGWHTASLMTRLFMDHYKNHLGVDKTYKLIRKWDATDAAVHDSQKLARIIHGGVDFLEVSGD